MSVRAYTVKEVSLRRLAVLGAGCASISLPTHIAAQLVGGSSQLSPNISSSSAAQVRTIRGQVLDALTGSGIARALVNVNGRQILSDAQGRFELRQFADADANIVATRPGYSSSADGSLTVQSRRFTGLDLPLEMKLYPDAVVTGMVTGSDGLPLPQVSVVLHRFSPGNEAQRWNNAAFTTTNSRGEYRVVTPGGKFRVAVLYTMRLRGTGVVVSPVAFPEAAAGSAGGYFALSPGEERHIDLRPRTGDAYPVVIQIDRAGAQGAQENRIGIRFDVQADNGDSFQPGFANAGSPAAYRLELPRGTYTIRAHSETREESLDGSVRVTVPESAAASGVALRLVPSTSLPVEVHLEPAALATSSSSQDLATTQASAAVDARQLNLNLRNVSRDSGDENSSLLQPRQHDDRTIDFRVPPGRYRLQGASGSPWYVVSATYGTSDLLTQDIVIGPGTVGQTIRLGVSNQRGKIKGHVDLAQGATGAWVYLIPQQDTLAVPPPVAVTPDGSFQAWVPIGAYEVSTVQGLIQEDLREPGAMARLGLSARAVTVTADAEVSVELTLEQISGGGR